MRAVRPLGSQVTLFPEDDEPAYEVDYSWSVAGSVSHWGHEHERLNVYRALYTVAHDGVGWKIAAWEVSEHRRADDGRSFITLVGDDPEWEDEPEWELEPGESDKGLDLGYDGDEE